jgi:hypothetical protein
MANVELVRLPEDADQQRIVRVVNSLVDVFLGNDGGRVLMVGHDGTSTDPNLGTNTGTGLYQTVVRSAGTNHLQVRKSDDASDRLIVTDTATTTPDLVASTTFASQGTSVFTGAATFNGLTTHNAGATFTAGQTVTGNGTVQFKTPLSAAASASLTLTTSMADVTGASLSLTPGVWRLDGVFYFVASGAGDVGGLGIGQLATTGGTATIALSTSLAVFTFTTATAVGTVVQTWLVTVTATTTAKLQAQKNAGTGASTCGLLHTTITASNA